MTDGFQSERCTLDPVTTYRYGLPSPPAFLRIVRAFPNLLLTSKHNPLDFSVVRARPIVR